MDSICYILNSFPRPSETFISDELSSMLDLGIKPYVLIFNEGEMKILHPSARKIIDSDLVRKIKPTSKQKALIAVLCLFMLFPRNTLFILSKALRANDRWLYFQAVPYALSLIKKNVQFIHSHFADHNFKWAKTLSEWSGIPFGVTTHGYDLRNDPIPVNEASQLFADADLVVTISAYNKALMIDKYGIHSDKIRIIHCGIYTDRFNPDQSLEKFNDSKLNIINIGRLVPQKGQDILLRALAEAKERGVQFELKIIGAGPLLDDLTELADSLEISSQVYFLNAQNQDVVIEMLKKADMLVLSSRSEGLPVVCMEAMAMEVLLIASRITGIPELVSDRENGLLVEPEDVQGLADTICWADQNRDALQEMTKSARKKVEKDFNRIECTKSLIHEIKKSIK